MDTITQIALGAAVGEAVLGKKMGNKAPMWGAALGIVPDLDVLILPFVDAVQGLAIHRGISHSLFFCFAASPIFGWSLDRWYSKQAVGWRSWSWMAFWVLLTHIGIDLFTTYGTQILQPFSDRLFSLNAIFIIDPFYTVPLAAGVITALFMQNGTRRREWANYAGIIISSLYLLAALAIKTHVHKVFEENFDAQDIRPEQQMTTPAPFNIFLWNGYATVNDTLYAGLYSIFDDNNEINFHRLAQNKHLLEAYRGQLPVERIKWFSQGFFTAGIEHGNLRMHDLRFGRSDLWLTNQPAPPSWSYRFLFNADSANITGFERYGVSFDRRSALFGPLLDRIGGEK